MTVLMTMVNIVKLMTWPGANTHFIDLTSD